MSRVGKKPIPLPGGVKISIGEHLEVTGPKGKLSVPIPEGIKVSQGSGQLQIERANDDQAASTWIKQHADLIIVNANTGNVLR